MELILHCIHMTTRMLLILTHLFCLAYFAADSRHSYGVCTKQPKILEFFRQWFILCFFIVLMSLSRLYVIYKYSDIPKYGNQSSLKMFAWFLTETLQTCIAICLVIYTNCSNYALLFENTLCCEWYQITKYPKCLIKNTFLGAKQLYAWNSK